MHAPQMETNNNGNMSETRLLLLISAVQFVNILDFMVVMPLGPDFSRDLGISLSHVGWVGGAYTGAAAIVGLLAARFLDRFDRRAALAVTLTGLVIGTACGGLADGLYSLMAARVIAGGFGGPAAALSLSIVADVVPPARRGRALGLVMGAFSLASVLGLPAALELARLGGWRSAFFAVAGMGVLVASAAVFMMPPLRAHLNAAPPPTAAIGAPSVRPRRSVIYALACTFTVMVAAFSVIPNISSYVQGNLHYPREQLGVLYFAGGIVSFLAMRLMGPVVDRFGSAFTAGIGTVSFVAILGVAFVAEWKLPVMLLYVTFMTSMAIRNVSLGALSSRVPLAHERARFMSLQSAVQHGAAALGAVLSAQLLSERADHSLAGMPQVASMAIGLALFLPFLLRGIERDLEQRDAASAARDSARPSTAFAARTPGGEAVVHSEL
jgi:predicted MFS family arabinose efflux permease